MVVSSGGRRDGDLAGNVAFIDGQLYPLHSYECDVQKDVQNIGIASSMQSQKVTSGIDISGTLETYRIIDLPAHLGTPKMHTVYLFDAQEGTSRRIKLDGVFFNPQLTRSNDRTQTVDFIAKEIQHD